MKFFSRRNWLNVMSCPRSSGQRQNVNRVVRCKSWVNASALRQRGQLKFDASGVRAVVDALPIASNSPRTALGESWMLDVLSNQKRLHDAHEKVSTGRSVGCASRACAVMAPLQLGQLTSIRQQPFRANAAAGDPAARSRRAGLARFVLRRGGAGVRQVLADVQDILPSQRVPVVRPVDDALVAVELHADSRAGQRLEARAQVVQQRLDFAPLDVAADGVVEDRAEQVFVLVAHVCRRGERSTREDTISGDDLGWGAECGKPS